MGTTRAHAFNDPIHKLMRFTEEEKKILKPIIDDPIFQRLRHIKQMSTADVVFPGATHTRFSHSIGACYVAAKIAEQLNREEKEKHSIMIALLLHDIGHGPFSHSFEKLFVTQDDPKETLLSHEGWTELCLNEFGEEAKNKIGEDARKILLKKTERKIDILSDIMSSQLDADRMDYLLRDSCFCGVSFGKYDIKWIMRSMCECKDADNNSRLGIKLNGVAAVEHFLIQRFFLRKTVCFHRKVIAAEFVFLEFLRALIKDIKNNKGKILKEKCGNNQLLNFLIKIQDNFSLDGFISSKEKFETNKNYLMKDCFQCYKNMTDIDMLNMMNSTESCNELESSKFSKMYLKRNFPLCINIIPGKELFTKIAVEEFRKKKSLDQGRVYWYEPVETIYKYKENEQPILVDVGKAYAKELSMVMPFDRLSNVIQYISGKDQSMLFLLLDKKLEPQNELIELLLKNGCCYEIKPPQK